MRFAALNEPARAALDRLGGDIQPWVLASLALIAGAVCGVAAWGLQRAPAAAIALPWLLAVVTRRHLAFLIAFGYYLGGMRFLPELASGWFEGSGLDFYLAPELWWVLASAGSALIWAMLWSARTQPWRYAAWSALAMVATLAPPLGGFVVAHPIVGWASLAEAGTGWFGLMAAATLSAGGAALVRLSAQRRENAQGRSRALHRLATGAATVAVLSILTLKGYSAHQPHSRVVAEDLVAVRSQFGAPPVSDSETIERIEKVGRAVQKLAAISGSAPRLTVFAENAIGQYDTTFKAVVEAEIINPARASAQVLVFGAETKGPQGRQNLAIVVRPDGSSAVMGARHPVPLTLWRPWDPPNHQPIAWFQSGIVRLTPEILAAVRICYELLLPMVAIMDQLDAPDHNVVVGMANLWSDASGLAFAFEHAHAQALANLFGDRLVLAVNVSPRPATAAAPAQQR